MTDNEFIVFLCKLFWSLWSGSEPTDNDYDVIRQELSARNIDPDDIFVY